MRVTSTEFQQNIGRYQDEAQREPVAITKNGRDHTVLMSAAFFERSKTWTTTPSRPSPAAPCRTSSPTLTSSSKTGNREPAATTARPGHLLRLSLGA